MFMCNKIKKLKILITTVIAFSIILNAYCFAQSQITQVSLLVQQTPANGGTVTPDSGVHSINANSEITLTARPKNGFQFVYWLGDVTDPTSNQTTAYLDSPKIIIAVFEKTQYDYSGITEIRGQIQQGSSFGGLRTHAQDYSRTEANSAGGKRPPKPPVFNPPVNDPVPVPVPEPTTISLFLIGALALLKKYRTKHSLI